MKIKIIFFFIVVILTSCQATVNKKNIKKDIDKDRIKEILKYKTIDFQNRSENIFFKENRIEKDIKEPFLSLYFDYLSFRYENFIRKSKIFIKNNSSSPLLYWILSKYLILKDNYIIDFEDIKYIGKESDLELIDFIIECHRYKDINKILLEEKTKYKNFKNWSITGPYRFITSDNFNNFRSKKTEPFDLKYIQNREIDYKKGGIIIDEKISSSGIYHLKTYFKTKNKIEGGKIFFNMVNPIIVYLDNKILWKNPLNPNDQILYDFVDLDIEKGEHKLEIIYLNLNSLSENFIKTNFNWEKINKVTKLSSFKNNNLSLYDEMKQIYNLQYGKDIKNIILFDIFSELQYNYDIAYQFLTLIRSKNYYIYYLYYKYYINNNTLPKAIKLGKIEEVLKNGLKFKKDSSILNYLYLTLFKKGNSYTLIDQLERLESENKDKYIDFIRYKLISLYLKTGENRKALNKIWEFKKEKNWSLKIYQKFTNFLWNSDIDFYKEIVDDIKNKQYVSYIKKDYNEKEIKQIANFIENHPYSLLSIELLYKIKETLPSIYNNYITKLYKNFPITLSNSYLKFIESDLLSYISSFNFRIFKKAIIFLDKFDKYFKIENHRNVIKEFLNNGDKRYEKDPITKVIDEDIIFINSKYDTTVLNYSILRVNSKEGINRYATLSRSNNYLYLYTINHKNMEEIKPDFNMNTSEITLKNLEIGDFIVMVTYNNSSKRYSEDFNIIGNFYYQTPNSNIYKAKLTVYTPKNFPIDFTPVNNFNKDNIQVTPHKDMIKYQYTQKNIFGVKSEPFSPRDLLTYIPNLFISIDLNWNKIYQNLLSSYEYSVLRSRFMELEFKKFNEIKNIEQLKSFIYNILKDYTHYNTPYSKLESTYLSKKGNLVYLLNQILKKKGIKSNILITHTKDNFHNDKIADGKYYTYYILKIFYKKKIYYIDPVSKWITFNSLSPFANGERYLEIDSSDLSIKKGKLEYREQLYSKTDIDIKILENKGAKISLKLKFPSFLSISLRRGFKHYSLDGAKKGIHSFIVRKIGYIENFDLKILNLDDDFKPLELDIKFNLKNFVRVNGDKMEIDNLLKIEWADGFYNYQLFDKYLTINKRETPITLYFYNNISDISITPPKNYTPKTDINSNLESKYGKYLVKTYKKGDTIHFKTTYQIKTALYQPEEYNNLKKFSEKIDQIMGKEIIFEKKSILKNTSEPKK